MSIATADDFRPRNRKIAALAGIIGQPRPKLGKCLLCGREAPAVALEKGVCAACRKPKGGAA